MLIYIASLALVGQLLDYLHLYTQDDNNFPEWKVLS